MNDLKTIIGDSRSHTPKTCIILLFRSIGKGMEGVRTWSSLGGSRNWLEGILKVPGVKLMFLFKVVVTELRAVARTPQTKDLSLCILL